MGRQQQTHLEESRRIRRVVLYAFLLNFLLAAVKGAMAFFTNSLALTASAVDSSIDSIGSLVMLGGVHIANRKTEQFPLGLYKVENVLSVIVAIFIFLAGYEIAGNAFFGEASTPDISSLVLGLHAGATLAVFLFARYASSAGRHTESPTLIAEGRHRLTDAFSSLIVLISLALDFLAVEWRFFGLGADQLAAVIVLIFIAHAGWQLLADGMRVLLDASIDFETLNQIKDIVQSDPMVTDVRSLVGRNAGRYRFLNIQVLLRTKDLEKAHRVSMRIEEEIRRRISHVESVAIHYEPQEGKNVLSAVPLNSREGDISDHFGEAPYFALIDFDALDNRIEGRHILENPFQKIEKGKGIKVAEWLVGKKVDKVWIREGVKHKGPDYVFSNAGVKVANTTFRDLDQLVGGILSGDAGKAVAHD